MLPSECVSIDDLVGSTWAYTVDIETKNVAIAIEANLPGFDAKLFFFI